MSTWKSARESAVTDSPKDRPVDAETDKPPVRQLEITAFELESDPENGCDPYNSTGQFCLEELKKYRSDD